MSNIKKSLSELSNRGSRAAQNNCRLLKRHHFVVVFRCGTILFVLKDAGFRDRGREGAAEPRCCLVVLVVSLRREKGYTMDPTGGGQE